ncbi:MAG: cobaltochelatase subunit CobN, partial [Thermoplasmata archaeon]|nr:cobaltochelatase subunit CobN [Thermoplasmata archaeon]
MKRFDRLLSAIESNNVCTLLACTDDVVTDAFRRLFIGTDGEFDTARSYYVLGGDSNFRSLFLWALRRFDSLDIDVPEPERPPAQGIYYPGRDCIGFDEYLGTLDPSRPNIGIMFYQKQWLTGNLGNIDGLIRAVERRGGNPVPVFLQTYEDPLSGAIGVKRVLREHLTRDGKPVLDAIIETMSFSQTLIATPGCGEQVSDDNFFASYGVPVLQSMTPMADLATWRADINGLTPSEVAFDVAHPEFDGQIITVPSCTTERMPDGSRVYVAMDDRDDRVADIACMWAGLRRTANPDRKVAVLLYMYPPKTANAGGAAGLDTFASVVNVLHRMRDDGYDVGDTIPETPRELVELLLSGLTNDTDWLSDEDVARRSLDILSVEDYNRWYLQLSEAARSRIEDGWGKPPGEFYTADGGIMIPGAVFGNVLVGFQPDRGRDIQKSYHDPHTVMPHQYLGYYRWLRHVFGAQAVIHVGTHGTLEWLPGKSVALSGDCCPDYVLDSIPDIYPYVIGNPGEGIQAKRRAAAVIVDHMIPVMTRAGGYDEILELEGAIQKYMDAGTQGQAESRSMILAKLREIVGRMELYSDMKLDPGCTDAEFAEGIDDLYDYVVEVKGNLIKDGLHILGVPPEGDLMAESVYSLTRLDNGDVPSLRGSVAGCLGYDIQELIADPSARAADGRLNGEVLDEVEGRDTELIREMMDAGFD